MAKFGRDADRLFALLDPKKCLYYGRNQPFDLVERKKAGSAKITVKAAFPCFHIPDPDDQCRFSILDAGETDGKDYVRRCADHMVFLFDQGTNRWTVHIFELKRTISRKIWTEDVLIQFNGALIRAYAISGILQAGAFANIYLHCAYREQADRTSPAAYRTLPGRKAPGNYLKDQIELISFPDQRRLIHNCPIQLDKETGIAAIPWLEI